MPSKNNIPRNTENRPTEEIPDDSPDTIIPETPPVVSNPDNFDHVGTSPILRPPESQEENLPKSSTPTSTQVYILAHFR